MMNRIGVVVVVVVLVGCGAKGPPPDFAPDPGLAARIQDLRMIPIEGAACPGSRVRMRYSAVLDDGSEIPFSTEFDEDNPPALHVVMLSRSSPEARTRQNGDWDTESNPLMSVKTGFRLSAFLKVDPSLSASFILPPEYDCLPTRFSFTGADGADQTERSGRGNETAATYGGRGADGPDVTVRLGNVSTPFYDRLIVVGIEVGNAPPMYVFGHPDRIPGADWLTVESRGGEGGRGRIGQQGAGGGDGTPGCPGSPGGAGGPGGKGWPGGSGGNGGTIRVFTPEEDPFMAGLVQAVSLPGPGGPGGAAGEGGPGGPGGRAVTTNSSGSTQCVAGPRGPNGAPGESGLAGPSGAPGPNPVIVTVPGYEVLGPRVHPVLAELLLANR